MRVFVKAKAGSKENKVISPKSRLFNPEKEEEYYIIHTKELPRAGKANDALVGLLAEHFGVSRARVRLVSGSISKIKVFEIN